MADTVIHPDLTLGGLSPFAQRASIGAAAIFVGIGVLGVSLLDSSRAPDPATLYREAAVATVSGPVLDALDPATDHAFNIPVSPLGTPLVAPIPAPGETAAPLITASDPVVNATSTNRITVFNGGPDSSTGTAPGSSSAPAEPPSPEGQGAFSGPEAGAPVPTPATAEVIVDAAVTELTASAGGLAPAITEAASRRQPGPGAALRVDVPVAGQVEAAAP